MIPSRAKVEEDIEEKKENDEEKKKEEGAGILSKVSGKLSLMGNAISEELTKSKR